MINRPFWIQRLDQAWRQASIVWLTGVRRVGKTVLAKALPGAEFINCDLPSSVERLRDPEAFFRGIKKGVVVLDEVHQLPDPSRLLKIAADAFPGLKILATGSSTLAATAKFRDSLTGRKRVVELTPALAEELPAFGVRDIRDRLFRGGLPQALLAEAETPSSTANGWIPITPGMSRNCSARGSGRNSFVSPIGCSAKVAACWRSRTWPSTLVLLAPRLETGWRHCRSRTWPTSFGPTPKEDGGKSFPSQRSTASTRGSCATPGAGSNSGPRTVGSSGNISCWTRCAPSLFRRSTSGVIATTEVDFVLPEAGLCGRSGIKWNRCL